MARVVLVHGFNVRDRGEGTVDELADPLRSRGHDVDTDSADYGWFGLWSVRFRSGPTVKRLAKALLAADVVITHSNGANFTHKAMKLLPFEHAGSKLVIHFSPALNKNAEIPAAADRVHVFHNPHDWVVKSSSLLWFHPWGAMGAYGYTGHDIHVTNHKIENKGNPHSFWFAGVHKYTMAHRVNMLIQEWERQA